MTSIFLSYRRSDSRDITYKIHAYLIESYGQGTVFLDEESLPPGEDIRHYIRDQINQCSVVLPIIGAAWLDSMVKLGLSSGNWFQPKDWVRIELEEALANPNVTVVPILLNGISMPRAEALPESIQALSYRNGIPINAGSLQEDLPLLVRRLDRLIEGSTLELSKQPPSFTDDEIIRQAYYRHEVRYCLESNDGHLDAVGQIYLDALRQHLQLTREVCRHIQSIAQQPYQRYTATVQQLIAHQSSVEDVSAAASADTPSIPVLDQRSINHLRRLHHHLALPRWKAKKIEAQMQQEWKERQAALG